MSLFERSLRREPAVLVSPGLALVPLGVAIRRRRVRRGVRAGRSRHPSQVAW